MPAVTRKRRERNVNPERCKCRTGWPVTLFDYSGGGPEPVRKLRHNSADCELGEVAA